MTYPIHALTAPGPLVLVLLTLLGCGSDGSGPNDGPLTLDGGARVSRMVPAAGATLSTLAGDGTRYTLVIPAAAIRDSAAITMTPVLAATGALGDAGLVAGVRFEPEGLVFALPATLTIELPAGSAGGYAAVAAGDGSTPHLVVSTTEGRVVTFAISHFSVAAVVASADAIPVPPQGAISVAAQQVISEALGFLTAPSAEAVQTIIDAFHTWYAGSVRPKLQAAAADGATDVMLLAASSDYSAWLLAAGLAGVELGAADAQLTQGLDAEVVEGRQLAAAAFEAGIARNNAACLAQPTNLGNAFLAANNAFYWQEVAGSSLAADYPSLQLDAVIEGLCLSVVFDAAAFPEQITVGETYPLNVRVGYSIGGAAPILAFSPLQSPKVEAQPVGAVAASAAEPLAGFTDGGATFATSLAVQQNAVVINVHACALGHVPDGRVTRNVCTDTLVVRNGDDGTPPGGATVRVIRDSVMVLAGGLDFFSAVVTPSPANAVTWTATGGTISAASPTSGALYTAGEAPGTYAATATSIDAPGSTGTAKIVIVAAATGAYAGTFCAFLHPEDTSCTTQSIIAVVSQPLTVNGKVYVGFAWTSPVGGTFGCYRLARLVSGTGSATLAGTGAHMCSGGISGDIDAEGSWSGTFSGSLTAGHLAVTETGGNGTTTYDLNKTAQN